MKAESEEHAKQWWTQIAELIATQMKRSGVKSFRVELNARRAYDFVVTPETPVKKVLAKV